MDFCISLGPGHLAEIGTAEALDEVTMYAILLVALDEFLV